MKKMMVTTLIACLFTSGGASGEEKAVTLDFSSLDDFKDSEGWSVVESASGDPAEKKWAALKPGSGILINGEKGKAGNLVTKFRHGDLEARIEFMIPKGSNSGIYFQGCYEVQILDSFGKSDEAISVHDCGAIYERWDEKRDPKGFEGTIPTTNASKAPGEWQSFHIVFRAPRFDSDGRKMENARFVKVVHNGELIHENVEVTGPTRGGSAREVAEGPLRIQGDHGPVAFRKFEMTPLELD